MHRDYSPFVFREELLKKRPAKKRKKENKKQTNGRVREGAASVNELRVNRRGEANERTERKEERLGSKLRAEQLTNGWPNDGLAIRFAMMTTTSKPRKIKKQFNRKQPPTSLKNNLANFRSGESHRSSHKNSGSGYRSSARTANGLVDRNSEGTLNKQPAEEERRTERKITAFGENNSPISESNFRRSSKQFKAERTARQFNLIKWTRPLVTPGARLLERQASDQTNRQESDQTNRQSKQSNRSFKAGNHRSTTNRQPLFVKRFGIDF